MEAKKAIEVVKAYYDSLWDRVYAIERFEVGYTRGEQEELKSAIDAVGDILNQLEEAGFEVYPKKSA